MITGTPRQCRRVRFLVALLGFIAGSSAPEAAFAERLFLRGDSNDDSVVDISDALHSLGYLFLGSEEPPCTDAADSNDDGTVDISDATFTLGYLFLGSSAPPAPGPDLAGPDPTADDQGCGPPGPMAPALEPWSEPPASARRQVHDDNKDVAPKTNRDEAARRHHSLGTCEWEDIVLTGQVRRRETDLRVPGRGLDFAWVRTYRSSGGPSTAMGHGWDFSYNIRVEPLGGSPPSSVRLHDGGGRADELTRRPDGLYVAPGVLLEGEEAPDGAFIITFRDQGTWRCHPLDGSPVSGKIEEIRDRSGNRLAFEYDDAGRLVRIIDTLDRECEVSYDEDGMISGLRLELWVDKNGDGTVTRQDLEELDERRVSYQHMSRQSVSGSRGDLRSVSVPVTPSGEPLVARSRTYTYTTGFADEELNHNLLTVSDGAGRVLVRNQYSPELSPLSLHHDRIIHRDIAARSLSFHYAGGGGGGGSGGLLTIVRDGLGNVSEYLHDERRRLVRLREYTGRSDPSLPVTETENRPAGKLRADDPDYYETRFEHNDDSIVTRVDLPNGSTILFDVQAPAPGERTLSRGNVLVQRTLPGPLGAVQTELVQRFEYDPLYQSETLRVDAKGGQVHGTYSSRGDLLSRTHAIPSVVESFEYDEHGQLVLERAPGTTGGHRPVTTYTYSDWNAVVLRVSRDTDSDGDGAPDTIAFSHDALGNVTRVVDGRGNATEYERNQIGEIVRVKAPVTTPGGVDHVFLWDCARDPSGNVTRVTLRDGKDPAKLVLQFFEYDEWSRLVRHYRQAGDVTLPSGGLEELTSVPPDQLDRFVVSEYSYDAAGNVSRIVLEGGGKQPDPLRNVTIAHDERGLPWRVTRAAGSPDAATEEYDYTPNGLLRAYTQEPVTVEVPHLAIGYDGFDRRVRSVDAMGNVELCSHDPNGNVTRVIIQGELADTDGIAANVELERTDYFHDPMDRLVRLEEHLDVDPVPEAARRKAVTVRVLTDLGQLSSLIDPNGNVTQFEYDTAARLERVTDAEGNAVTLEHDENDNVVRTTRLDRESGATRETPWIHKYDSLDRCVATEDADGNATTCAFDYRSLPVSVRDALGNVTELVYDSLGRCAASSRLLTDPATGALLEKLTRAQTWDPSSRLVAVTDENGNTTRYTYDSLDRCTTLTRADGSVARVRYDAFDNIVEAFDPNGTRVVSGYDRMHRLTRNSISPGEGVSGDTTFEEFAYDGLSRPIRAIDDDSSVGFTYDPLSRVVRESLNGLETAYAHDAAGNVLSIRTAGGHAIEYEYDGLHRARSARTVGAGQVTEILARGFGGPSRVTALSYPNGVRSTFAFDSLLRPSRSTHATDAAGGFEPFDDRLHEHDAAYRKTARRSLLAGGLEQTYEYDSADRLARSTFGLAGAPPNAISYFLDAAGDRMVVDGGPDAGPYFLDPTLPEPADRQMRQYTETPAGARQYDRNGNLTAVLIGGRVSRTLAYDFAGRLVRSDDSSTQTTARHRYDALGRRWGHDIAKPIIQNIRARTFAGPNVVEERDETGQPVAFIDYIADGVPARRSCCADLDGDGAPDVIQFFHTDDAGNVTAVSDAQGRLVERYEYGDYGRPRIFDAAGAPIPESAIGNPFLLGASWYDAETGYFVVGNDAPELGYEGRHYDPHTGAEIGQSFAVWPHMHQHGTHKRLGTRRGGQIGAPKKSFGQKLGGFAKGVAQVGLGVASTRKMMGAPKIGEATAVFNISQAGEWLAWVETVWNKQCVEKDITIRLADQDYSRRTAGGGGKAQGQLGQKAKAWMVNNYEVHPVFGLKTEWITSIGLPKITPKIAKESHGKFATTSPGHKYVGEIRLRGHMTADRKPLCAWINEVVQGKPWKRSLTITELLSVDGSIKDDRAAVWKEFSPAEEQLKGNPRH